MTRKPTHRRAPWTFITEETGDGENVYPKLMKADHEHEIFGLENSSAQDFADADFIVHRVNCHDDLVKALEIAQAKLAKFNRYIPPIDVAKDKDCDKISTALRTARQS